MAKTKKKPAAKVNKNAATAASAKKAGGTAKKATRAVKNASPKVGAAVKRAKKSVVADAKRSRAARPKARRTRENRQSRQQRAFRVLRALKAAYAKADCALRHSDAYELLVATILSAQCTDERVNQVTPELFHRYPNAEALAAADQSELEEVIRSTGFYRNKAKNLIGMARRIVEKHEGEIPDTMNALLDLPGVARKTANCVLGTWFGKNEGIVVDTHVGRVALRLRLLTTARDDKDAVRIEQDLMDLFPQSSWTYLSHALIEHGRQVCKARNPRCDACPLASDCPSAGTFDK